MLWGLEKGIEMSRYCTDCDKFVSLIGYHKKMGHKIDWKKGLKTRAGNIR